MRTPTKKPAPIGGSNSGPDHIQKRYQPDEYNPSELDKVRAQRDVFRDAYEHIMWLYAEAICRTSPERLEYLLSVELPFHLQPEVLADLEAFVDVVLRQQATEQPQKVAA